MKRKRALFVAYGGGHVAMVLPVIRELERRRPDIECMLMALTTGHLKAKAVRPVLGYHDFLHLVDAAAARLWGERLSEGNASPDVPTDETVAYLGINYLELIEQFGPEGAAAFFQQHGRRGFRPQHFLRRVLAFLQPDVVVATNAPRSEQAALEAARTMGMASVGMVDLFGLDTDPYVRRENKPDVTCVLAEDVKKRLIQRGFDTKQVVVTGNPAFDGLFTADNLDKARHFIEAKGWGKLDCLLWAGQTEPRSHPMTTAPAGRALPIEIESVLRSHVRQREGLALIVRYHPSDWFSYPRHPDEPRIHFSITPEEPLHPLILAARMVVVQTSTVGLEAAIAGKPVISVENAPGAYHGFSLARLGVSVPSATPSELPQAIDALLASATAGSVAPGHSAYASDGRAASRVAQVVEQALENGCQPAHPPTPETEAPVPGLDSRQDRT